MNSATTKKYMLTGLAIVAVVVIGLWVWKIWNRMRMEGYDNEMTIENNTDMDVTFGATVFSSRSMKLVCDSRMKNIVIPKHSSVPIDSNNAGVIRLSKNTVWISPSNVTGVTFLDSSGKQVPYTEGTIPAEACSVGEEVRTYTFQKKNSFDSTLDDVMKISIGAKSPSPSPSDVDLMCKCTTVR